jgi:hypothetical protein
MTNIARWLNLKESWTDRIELMARFIKPGSSVLDMGCGTMALKKYLPPGCSYQSCDVAARESATIVCDFNKNEYPPVKQYDYVFCSGVLEYIHDVPGFLKELRKYSDTVIVSYVATKSNNRKRIRKRRGLDWVNHYNFFEIIVVVLRSGYTVQKVMDFATQKIFVLNKLEECPQRVSTGDVLKILWADCKSRFQGKF